MRLAILKEGAIVVKDDDQQWLFGAPEGIKGILEAEGIDMPKAVFTTNLRAPGMGRLGPVLSFKEKPLRVNGLSAVPVVHKHGTDYKIETKDGSILFSERGDVSTEDVQGYDLAIIKNKHRADAFGDNVITWPWKSTELNIVEQQVTPIHTEVSFKVWPSLENVPDNLKKIDDVPLSLEQANFVARAAEGSGDSGDENWAVAISSFKQAYKKEDKSWVKQNKEEEPEDDNNLEIEVEVKIPKKDLDKLKELVPSIPDEMEDYWSTVYKDEDSTDRWASISSVAVWDRQNELFTSKAMDWAMAFSNIIEDKGPLRYRHVPGLDGGDCDTQLRVGDFLFESGTFRDTPLGSKLKELMSDPEYGVSLGLMYAKDDLEGGVYKRAAIFERSLTKRPAVLATSIITKEDNTMQMLTEEQLTEVATELGFEVTEVKTMYERALSLGTPYGLKEFKEFALKSMGGAVAALGDDDKENKPQTEVSRKEMLAILEGLEAEEMAQLKEMITETEKEDAADEDEDKDEDEMEYPDGKYPKGKGKMKKAKKDDEEEQPITEFEQMKEVFAQQSAMMLEQTKSIGALAAAMAGGQNQASTNQAVAEFMAQLPRKQAGQFITSGKEGDGNVGDDDKAMIDRLNALEAKLKEQPQVPGTDAVYQQFTSRTLNAK